MNHLAQSKSIKVLTTHGQGGHTSGKRVIMHKSSQFASRKQIVMSAHQQSQDQHISNEYRLLKRTASEAENIQYGKNNTNHYKLNNSSNQDSGASIQQSLQIKQVSSMQHLLK